jgi:hypothetical protein
VGQRSGEAEAPRRTRRYLIDLPNPLHFVNSVKAFSDQSQLPGLGYGFGSVVDVKLAIDVLDVKASGVG